MELNANLIDVIVQVFIFKYLEQKCGERITCERLCERKRY